MTDKRRAVTPTERSVLRLLARGPRYAREVDAHAWPDAGSQRAAVTGGGCYAAQMLLGRMRRCGWCRTRNEGAGASLWEITDAGLQALRRTIHEE